MGTLSSFDRNKLYHEIEQKELDLLVIGGGITGAGIALDAVMRGLRVGLVEMQDFAAGTSSRSTKLVHGGLRYLKQFEVKMVSEVGKERAIVYENGPHVTTPEWMMLPFYKGGTFGPLMTNVGLRAYDFLAGVKKEERRQILTKEEALKKEPLLKAEDLKGAGYYVEYKTDDARLTLEVLKKAVEHGAIALNYAKAEQFIYRDGRLTGVEVEDQLDLSTHIFNAKYVVNATGPWVDTLREKDHSKHGKSLQLTKGIHLVFDQSKFPLKQAIYFDTPDGRMVFAIPRDGKAYVGTTDTVFKGDISQPPVNEVDQTYVLDAVQFMFPNLDLKEEDIESSWAGLRPLIHEDGKDPSEISRKDEIFESDSGLISMAGGKLTGYRKMAEEVLELITNKMKENQGILYGPSNTIDLPISGGDVGGSDGFVTFKKEWMENAIRSGMKETDAEKIVNRYGSNAFFILENYKKVSAHPFSEKLDPVTEAILQYSMEHEAVCKPIDFFNQRTSALYFDIGWIERVKSEVIAYMKGKFNWSEETKTCYDQELAEAIQNAKPIIPSYS